MDKSDKDWFHELYLKNYDSLKRMANSVFHDDSHAEDLVHDVFTVCLEKLEEVKAHEVPNRWLTRTMKNRIGNELQKQKIRKTVPISEAAIHSDAKSSLEDVLPGELSDKEKQLLIWYFKDELSYAEISRRLHISENTCRARVFRAKERCKKLMEK